jgi:hypothetical protein
MRLESHLGLAAFALDMPEFGNSHSNMKDKRFRFLATMRVARAVLAATLLLGIMASNFPVATIASGPTCALACCAGRAPHAAGSCMNGSCHAFLKNKTTKPKVSRTPVRYAPEPMCGLTSAVGRNGLRNVSKLLAAKSATSQKKQAPPGAHMSSPSMTKPCPSGCGDYLFASSNLKRERQKAVLAFADRPRPPSSPDFVDSVASSIRERTARCRKCVPRGPPVS